MALRLRRGIYHADITVGEEQTKQRIRQSLHTTDWREAKRKEKDLINDAKQGIITAKRTEFARLPFSQAVGKYIEEITPRLRPFSVRSEKERGRKLTEYFDKLTLAKITPDSIRDYISHRKAQGMSNRTCNMECGLLRRLLERAKLWRRFIDDYKPLPQSEDIGRAMTPEEEACLTATAQIKPEWRNARLAYELARNTAMRSAEIRNLRWGDIDLINKTLAIRRAGTKTNGGVRIIPLNTGAQAVILDLREIAKQFADGQVSPEWYLFAFRQGLTRPDPTRPITSWRTAWRALREAAAKGDKGKGIPAIPTLAKLRFHDLRHDAITRLAEGNTPDQVIMAIAGHVSRRMLEHYSHVRMQAKRSALDALSPRQSAQTDAQTSASRKGLTSQTTSQNGVYRS